VTSVKPVHDLSNREIVDEARKFAERLRDAGVAAQAANAAALRKYPAAAAAMTAVESKRDNVLEKAEQWAITKMARAIGFSVYTTSQTRAAKVTPGFPDLWLAHGERGFAGFWETKRQVGGRISHEQLTFGVECLAAKIPHGFGDRYEFAKWLTQHGFTPPAIPE
jgi:hypothetical protein